MRNVVKPPFLEVMVIGGYGADAGQSTEVLSVQERAHIRLLSCPAFSSQRRAQRVLGRHSVRDVPAALPPCPLGIFLGGTISWKDFSALASQLFKPELSTSARYGDRHLLVAGGRGTYTYRCKHVVLHLQTGHMICQLHWCFKRLAPASLLKLAF